MAKKASLEKRAKRRAGTQKGRTETEQAPNPPVPGHHPPVVGIGASAGGLDAFTRLLKSLPARTGLVYVVVQHLDPSHESILPELLARAAPIPVRQVKDGMRVAADHVYVIPPNTTMTMEDGTLRLVTRPKTRGPHMPIDDFLRSLAEIHRSGAIGVVLSGTGSDGALGIEAIKAEGGITMAQDALSARYSGMPDSAAATGHVDFILSPEEIAAQLDRIARHVASHPAPDELDAGAGDDVDKILALLRNRTGVDFRQYRRGTIHRRILRRMLLHRQDTKQEYLARLRSTPTELDALYEDLLIGVTSFFRDPSAFDALQRTAFPELMKARNGDAPIRVWVAGCAGGEETYSLAISLLEFLGERASSITVQIFATDLSETSIARARAGRYPDSIEAHVSPERLRRFFVREEAGYRILKTVRDLCVFARQNVVSDPPFSQLDLISCRNVLIYLEPTLQKRVFPIFHYALKPRGMLMLGTAESVGPTSGYFVAVDKKHRIYRRGTARVEPLDLATSPAVPGATTPWPTPSTVGDVQAAADRVVLSRYAPDGVVVNEHLEIVQFRGDTTRFLTHPPGLASLDLLKLVRPELAAPLRAALRRARDEGQLECEDAVALVDGDATRRIALEVVPFKATDSMRRFFAVFFREAPEAAPRLPSPATSRTGSRLPPTRSTSRARSRDVRSLREELQATKRHLQDVTEDHEASNEELRAANEEIQSSNEELQSTNEELETTKEEIQSTNEELTTLNEELRHRNQELATISADLANVLSSTQVPVLIVGNDLRIRRFTPAVERVLKVIPGDVGRPIGDVRRRIDIPDLEQRILRVSETLEATEQIVQDEDGRWWSMVIRPYRTADRQIDGAVIVFGDIDAAKRHERAIEEARVYAEGIVETIREPLVVLDAALCIESANRAFHTMFGFTPATIKGRSLFALGNGEWDAAPIHALLDRVVSRNVAVQDVEVTRAFPRIGYRTLLLNARPLDFGDGRPSLVLLAIDDATARKRAEDGQLFLADIGARLAASLDLSQTLDAITDLAVPRLADHCAIHLVAPDGALRLAREARAQPSQPSTTEASGRPADRVQEMALKRVLTDGDSELLGGPDRDHQLGASPTDHGGPLPPVMVIPLVLRGKPVGTLTLAAGDGARALGADLLLVEEFASRAALALDNAGLLAETRAARADADSARAVAETANRAKTDFLATMSHELRTPLNAILGYVQLLEMELRGPLTDAQRTALHRIALSEHYLSSVIGQILDYAKIDAGQLIFHMANVPLHETIDRVAVIMQAPMETQGLVFDYESGDPSLTVWADGEKVERIMLNLLSNAVKFTPRGGTVGLRYEPSDDMISIRVTDTGRGIAGDKLEAVFEPFVQIEKRTGQAGGTGLGLAISRDLARRMGGDVRVTSTPGEGSTFTLSLPRRAVPPTP